MDERFSILSIWYFFRSLLLFNRSTHTHTSTSHFRWPKIIFSLILNSAFSSHNNSHSCALLSLVQILNIRCKNNTNLISTLTLVLLFEFCINIFLLRHTRGKYSQYCNNNCKKLIYQRIGGGGLHSTSVSRLLTSCGRDRTSLSSTLLLLPRRPRSRSDFSSGKELRSITLPHTHTATGLVKSAMRCIGLKLTQVRCRLAEFWVIGILKLKISDQFEFGIFDRIYN